ncbi:hypothetical protein K435DRAFT_778446 [Dendrothele bispora CBS 962.96]|uniref:Uncharacterized protein n=1 Tax=Dendrothele bispora (strain CBS 962.96) TaxID=1314807 RepID=A0A4S8M3R9_DENBC
MCAERALESFERICNGFPSSNFGESLHTISEEFSGLEEGSMTLAASISSSGQLSGSGDLVGDTLIGVSANKSRINRTKKMSIKMSRRSFVHNCSPVRPSSGSHVLDTFLTPEEPEVEPKTEAHARDRSLEIEEVARPPTAGLHRDKIGPATMRSLSPRTTKAQEMYPQPSALGSSGSIRMEVSSLPSLLPSPVVSLPSSLPSLRKQSPTSSVSKFSLLSSIPSYLSKLSFRSSTRNSSPHSHSSPGNAGSHRPDLPQRGLNPSQSKDLSMWFSESEHPPTFKPVLPLRLVKKSRKQGMRASVSLPASSQVHFNTSPR